MRYKVVSFISVALLVATTMVFSVALTPQSSVAASLKQGHKVGARHASVYKPVKPARAVKPAQVVGPATSSANLTIKVAHLGQGCVKYDNKAVFTVLVSNVKGSKNILSDTITTVFQQPRHLAKLFVSGNDWSFHKNGSYYTATYIGSYPVKNGDSLGLITVAGIVDTKQGGSTTLKAVVDTTGDLKLSNNTDSSKTTLCNKSSSNGSSNSSSSHNGSSNSSSNSSSGNHTSGSSNHYHNGGSNSSSSGYSNGSSSNTYLGGGGSFPGLPLTGSDPTQM